jgi:phosphatidylserine/phosphatidylglycerophosphate/cardiolipin synthase-like enzyme
MSKEEEEEEEEMSTLPSAPSIHTMIIDENIHHDPIRRLTCSSATAATATGTINIVEKEEEEEDGTRSRNIRDEKLAAMNSSLTRGVALPPPPPLPLTATEEEVSALPVDTVQQEEKLRIEQALSTSHFHAICKEAAKQEVNLSISQLFHEYTQYRDDVPRLITEDGSCRVQLLRSVGKWSIGANTEISIFNAYTDCIRQAKHFIYIENQFFVSSTAGTDVSNNIAEVILDRIIQAYQQHVKFRVMIIIPQHPNGDFCDAMKAKIVMHYEYATINRSLTSLIQQVKKRCPGILLDDYLGFYSLRNWGIINSKIVTEQIYIHDKIMIIDDRIMIIGSANINDRSLLGIRDSEVAVKIEDTCEIESYINGKVVNVGFIPHTTRLKLMGQHVKNPNLGKRLDDHHTIDYY